MLEVKNLFTFYGKIPVLKNISFHLQAGEIVSLIGANGAGKTTTLKTISGVLKPKKGGVFFHEQPIHSLRSDEIVKKGISHVPEGRHIFPYLTVLENLEMGGYVKDKKTVKKTLEEVFSLFPKLAERQGQIAGTLSGGEQQMLSIARGLMSQPKLLLLDEPSLGLAPILVEQIFEKIKEINQQGTSILLVEQNAYLALSIADRGYIMETGQITLHAPAKELLVNPQVQAAYLGGEKVSSL
jgi:branched-chain amino acid transport system ATP-binding protein